MSASDLFVVAGAVAFFHLLWWCLSLTRRLRRLQRTSKLDTLTGLGSGDWRLQRVLARCASFRSRPWGDSPGSDDRR